VESLRRSGYRVDAVSSGAAAMELLTVRPGARAPTAYPGGLLIVIVAR
jgi:hypothetical protein